MQSAAQPTKVEATSMGGFERKPGGGTLVPAMGADSGGDPGKRTLTEQVQAKGDAAGGATGGAGANANADEAAEETAATAAEAPSAGATAADAGAAGKKATNDPAELRRRFDATPEKDVKALCALVAQRFNLKVTSTSDSSGAPWDKRGLRRCWDVLETLPPEHVSKNKDLSSLTRYRSTSIEGWASDDGEAAIGYGAGNNIDKDVEKGDFTDAKDPLRGKNIFDATVRHEIGHRVDAGVGGPAYTASDDGGGWQTWDSTAGMAERLVNASGGKISSWSNATEKKAILKCLQGVIDDRVPDEINDRLEALAFLSKHATDAAQQAKLVEIKSDNAVSALRVAFSHQGPWDLPTGGVKLGDRIYQESYDWPQWVSYKQAARTKKFSRYQFRAPGEWFAEAYATYYQPPGAKGALMAGLDDKTKAWFDAKVDPQHGAGGTTPAGAGGTKKGDGATPAKGGGEASGATAGGGAPAGAQGARGAT